MKQYALCIACLLLLLGGCKKEDLELSNPNRPTIEQSLVTEAGLKNFSLGILQKMMADVPDEGPSNILHIALTNHSILGDEAFVPYGNYSLRWVNQVHRITLPSGVVVTNPSGVDQKTQLQGFNSRDAGELNAFQYEWAACYYIIAQCNQLLKSLENPELQLSGNGEIKKNTFRAWAQWWKGYSYSRIGSMYLAGVLVDEPGQINDNFVDRTAVITEANRVLDECLATLASLSAGEDYNNVMTAIVASFNDNTRVVQPDMWQRQVYSLKARNLMANKKLRDMTAADWQQVLDLTAQGIQRGDNIFQFGMDISGTNDVTQGFFHPLAFIGEVVQFTFVSERLIQEFHPTDKRFTTNFTEFNPPKVDIRGRGLQFGTRWNPVYIENGGRYATASNLGLVPWACSYEENELMKAEALLQTGNSEGALQIVDAIRALQDAGLPPVAGKGLSGEAAWEEYRRERRVALFLKGTAFYDARRWGVTEPAAQGGGRAGAIVVIPGELLTPQQAVPRALPCFMDYNYLDYWDVPQNELDFNTPGPASAPVKN